MAAEDTHPNILWIQTDEQRTDSLGCYGSAWAKTPNVDALAARGVMFRNCFCQSPVCVPSRSSQLTCRYPQECNTMSNTKDPFPPGTVTFPEFFASAGYRTASFGKWHTPPHPIWQVSEEVRHIKKYATTHGLGEGYDERELRLVRATEYKLEAGGGGALILGGTYPGGDDNPSRYITDLGIEFLREHGSQQPFLLRVSHSWPHTPVLPPAPFDRIYRPEDIPIRYFDEGAYITRSRRDRGWGEWFGLRKLDRDAFAQMWTDYMGLCAYIDQEVGRLLGELEALGLAGDTIVLYSSDHGRALGEYGAAEKHTFDDAVWRVPFILTGSGRLSEGEVRDDFCGLIDTGRTLAGLAGLAEAVPDPWRGRSLFRDPVPPESEQVVFGQIGFPDSRVESAQQLREGFEFMGAMRVGVRTGRYRMDVTWMRDGEVLTGDDLDGQLFDLEADPLERHNLFHDPGHRADVDALLGRIGDWFEPLDRPDAVFSP